MSELRQDRTTGAWAIIAPERGLRPNASPPGSDGPDALPAFDPACPFCPGNEAQLPGILAEIPADRPPGWTARVVPNKYPVVQPSAERGERIAGHHLTMAGHGWHEVVIESPRHDLDPASMSERDVVVLVSVYRQRFAELIARSGIETVILFRNHGAASGASLRHPHSQLVALGTTPQRLRSMTDWMRHRMAEAGRCITCDELALEAAAGVRIVEQTQHFLALVPFAAATPFEVWLVPRRHQASYAEIEASECADLGTLLRSTLRRLKALHGDPPYSFVVESFDHVERAAPHAHWRVRIEPDLLIRGGFEAGTGLPINPSNPEKDAASLRVAVTAA